MKPVLLWGAGPGEIRAGLVENGRLTEFRLVRLRRNEEMLIAEGEHYTARVLSRLPDGAALVLLGGGVEAVLDGAGSAQEGRLIAVEMIRGPIPEPGQWKRARVRPLPDGLPSAEACWHPQGEPWERILLRAAPLVSAILCPDAVTANEVEGIVGARTAIAIDPGAIEEADFDSLIEQAASGLFTFTGGGLSIERTRAMTVIDVDGVGDALRLNLAAAEEISRLLRLLDIGGPIGIDFVSMRSRADRLAVDAALAASCTPLGPHERTAINGFGFAQIIRPRTGPSIPELLCGTQPGRLTLESRAIALLREAGRSRGTGPRRLVAPPAIVDLIRSWPEETGALEFSLGARIELVSDPAATGYGHVHVSQS